MKTRAYARSLSCVGLLAFVACAGVKQRPISNGTGGSGSGNGGTVGTGGAGNNPGTGGTQVSQTGCVGQCTDFEPTASNPNPLFDVGVSQDVGGLFGNPTGSGPCASRFFRSVPSANSMAK